MKKEYYVKYRLKNGYDYTFWYIESTDPILKGSENKYDAYLGEKQEMQSVYNLLSKRMFEVFLVKATKDFLNKRVIKDII
jgi:hypothetical protein